MMKEEIKSIQSAFKIFRKILIKNLSKREFGSNCITYRDHGEIKYYDFTLNNRYGSLIENMSNNFEEENLNDKIICEKNTIKRVSSILSDIDKYLKEIEDLEDLFSE